MAKILLLEDDPLMSLNVADFLRYQRHAVEAFCEGQLALDHLLISDFDLLILDWELPGISGLDVCRQYRSNGGKSPILFLTAKKLIGEKVLGFDAGADDYLTKPFEMKELLLRVMALLRRSSTAVSNILSAGDIELDLAKRQVLKGGKRVELQEKEFLFLEFLMRHPNQAFNSDALLQRVWPSDTTAGTSAVKTLVNRVRAKLDPDAKLIKTVHGFGYILEI